ncbi:MAG: hypothetical protein V4805_13860 [Pseudomonadota bacterium]
MTPVVLYLLIFHGVAGGVDVIFNHEIDQRLPQQPSARREQLLHSLRELLFAILFASLAWFEWRGWASGFIVAVIAAEVVVSTVDSVEEDRTRRLPVSERILHSALLINVGIYTALLAPILTIWQQSPTQLRVVDYGLPSAILSTLALFALGWSVRDAARYFKLRAVPALMPAVGK